MKKLTLFILSLTFVIGNSTQFAIANSDTPAKVISSKYVEGSRTRVFVSGNTADSGTLWSAKVPTKIKLSGSRSALTGKIRLKVANVASDDERNGLNVNFAIWAKDGRKITDRTVYQWSPVSPSTLLEISIFEMDKLRAGSYTWVITTENFSYEGKGEIQLPLKVS